MLQHPYIDPIALDFGRYSLELLGQQFSFHPAIRWYGLTYLVAFALFWWLGRRRVQHPNAAVLSGSPQAWSREEIPDILFAGVMGVIAGGRLGYCLFYKPLYYLQHPLEILQVWQGGMSFHGGMLGVVVAMWFYARSRNRSFFQVTDFIAPCVPTGLASGRIGNFINGELWGRAADPSLPWAMVFRDPAAGAVPRHPSQLYQFLLEGICLFALLWWFGRKRSSTGATSALFLLGYGVFRFIAEYFRQPDAHLGLLAMGLSMGQWLCLPMIGVGLWWFVRVQKRGVDRV